MTEEQDLAQLIAMSFAQRDMLELILLALADEDRGRQLIELNLMSSRIQMQTKRAQFAGDPRLSMLMARFEEYNGMLDRVLQTRAGASKTPLPGVRPT